MQELTQAQIFEAFDAIDRPELSAPDLYSVPWSDLDYFAWAHPTERKQFLVVPLKERLVGLICRVNTAPHTGFCDFCFSVDRVFGTSTIMVDSWERPRSSLGLNVCSNFDCSDSVRGFKWVYRMGETIPAGRRIERLQENVSRFARRVTGL